MIAQHQNKHVVHLVSPPSLRGGKSLHGRSLPAILCASAQNAGIVSSGTTIVVGDDTALSVAVELGLTDIQTLAPVYRNPRFMARNLHSLVPRGTHLICWSDELFAIASSVCPSTELISTAPSFAARASRRHTAIRVLDESDRDAWTNLHRDVKIDRSLLSLIDLFEPIYTRETLREDLKIGNRTVCIGAVSDSPQSTNARAFAFLLGLLACTGYDIVGVLPSNASGVLSARRHHRGLHKPFRLIYADEPIINLTPAMDLALHIDMNPMSDAFLLQRLIENMDVPCLRIHQGVGSVDMRSPEIVTPIIDEIDAILGIPPGSRVTP